MAREQSNIYFIKQQKKKKYNYRRSNFISNKLVKFDRLSMENTADFAFFR